MSSKIRHDGIIEQVADGNVKVRILQTSACAACKVAGHCNASEAKEKLVDVRCDTTASRWSAGQPVVVTAAPDVAGRALLWGFGLPFLLLVGVLVLVLLLTGSESLAGLLSLASLLPYYLLLWLLRDKMARRLSFQLEEAGC